MSCRPDQTRPNDQDDQNDEDDEDDEDDQDDHNDQDDQELKFHNNWNVTKTKISLKLKA